MNAAEKKQIIEIIKNAGIMAETAFYNHTNISTKAPGDLVTDADKAIEVFMKKELHSSFPKAGIYGEESGLDEGSEDRLFVIDPIDGTANFIFGVPYFAVSIAEVIKNNIVRGIVYNPVSKDLFYADKEKGANLNGHKISASSRGNIKDAFIILGFSANSENISRYQAEWYNIFSNAKKAMPLLSPSLNLCSVAMGKADAFIDFGCSFEGQAAGAFILQQAGGSVRNYDDSSYDFRQTGIVASNTCLNLEESYADNDYL